MRLPIVSKLCALVVLALALSMAAFSAAYADDAASLSAADADSGESVTVYLTVSDDGEFVTGCDGTVLANTPVTVEHFDLANYGLERFAYEPAGERPTLLHLLIRATEQYYFGQGMTPDNFDYRDKAMWVTNNPGSLYLKYFWGHDENLLYHVNDEYPEASPGWGLTCDRIVLNEGDTVDLAMFSDWGISSTSAFAYFKDRLLTSKAGEDVVFEGLSAGGMASSMAIYKTAMQSVDLRVSRDGGYTWAKAAAKTDGEGRATLRFDEPGLYLVSAGPEFSGYENEMGVDYRCVAPPIAVVSVTEEALPPLEVSFDACGGSNVPSQSVARYDRCSKPVDPVRPGYAFAGWYESPDLAREYDFGRAVTSDIVLYAKWEKDSEPTVVPANRLSGKIRGRIKAFSKASTSKKALRAKKAKKASFSTKKYVKVIEKTGSLSYGRVSVKGPNAKATKAAKKKIRVAAKAGKITVKKGLPRGVYTLKVKLTVRASDNYLSASTVVPVKIKVK